MVCQQACVTTAFAAIAQRGQANAHQVDQSPATRPVPAVAPGFVTNPYFSATETTSSPLPLFPAGTDVSRGPDRTTATNATPVVPATAREFAVDGWRPSILSDQDLGPETASPDPWGVTAGQLAPTHFPEPTTTWTGPSTAGPSTGDYSRPGSSGPDSAWPDSDWPGTHWAEPRWQASERRSPARSAQESSFGPRLRTGRLEQAYTQPYRSQMPSLKQARPGDPFYQPQSESPQGATGDCGDAGLFGEGDCGDGPGKKSGGRRGQWFGRYETLLVWPYYSNSHPGIATTAGSGLQVVEPFDYNVIWGNRGVVGWESQKGPGGQFQYTDVFAISQRLGQGVTGGLNTAIGQLQLPGSVGPLGIIAGPGQRLEASTREHLTSYRPTAFKRVYFPISTITGGFGVDHTILRQSVNYSRFADLSTALPSETLDGRRRFSGIGPTFDIEYHRPIGHTQLAMLGGAQLGVLFGSDRWEVFQDGGLLYHENSRRVVTNAVVRVGVEWSQAVGPRPDQRLFARFTIEGQNWLNLGNFSSSDSALGFLSGNFAIGAAF